MGFITFVVADVKMLVSKVVLFQTYYIVNNASIHLLGRTKVHIVIIGVLALAPLNKTESVKLDNFTLRECVAIDKLYLDEGSLLD